MSALTKKSQILAFLSRGEPLNASYIAKRVGCDNSYVHDIARLANVALLHSPVGSLPQSAPAAGVLQGIRLQHSPCQSFKVGVQILRTANLSGQKRLRYRAEPGRIILEAPEAKP